MKSIAYIFQTDFLFETNLQVDKYIYESISSKWSLLKEYRSNMIVRDIILIIKKKFKSL